MQHRAHGFFQARPFFRVGFRVFTLGSNGVDQFGDVVAALDQQRDSGRVERQAFAANALEHAFQQVSEADEPFE
ncbi:hypothetical protein [Yanghanlia caeni]|uniref:Uncharacterized protein n=1 Tax=Yanghanlia caeni TaxID=3064283 RepID=A0ABU1D3U1_9BURK|nr:hypothetical protein [Alcaligenaceae bacterium LG-2]